jgi:antirestriction protein ArdC
LPRWTCRAFSGRDFIHDDGRYSDHVVIVSQSLAQRTFPSVDADRSPTAGTVPFYRPSTDSIMLPLFETCRGADNYATLAHETTHWTAHESRLARDFGVAELGAAFLCADLDLTLEPREDHAA